MTDKPKHLAEYNRRAKRAEQWAKGSEEAYHLAVECESADMNGEQIVSTPKNRAITFKAALKMFLDGEIQDPELREMMESKGLSMNNIRTALVEQTMARRIPKIINDGDIESCLKLGIAAGEDLNPAATGNVIVRYVSKDDIADVDEHIKSVVGDINDDTDEDEES